MRVEKPIGRTSTARENEVSWFQESPAPSLELIELAKPTPDAAIVDIGGGASILVDTLLKRGFGDVTVLDLSEAALAAAKVRLGDKAAPVQWVAADVTRRSPSQSFDIWHDRAAFIFLLIPLIAPPTLLASLCNQAGRLRHHRDIRTRRPCEMQRLTHQPVRCREFRGSARQWFPFGPHAAA